MSREVNWNFISFLNSPSKWHELNSRSTATPPPFCPPRKPYARVRVHATALAQFQCQAVSLLLLLLLLENVCSLLKILNTPFVNMPYVLHNTAHDIRVSLCLSGCQGAAFCSWRAVKNVTVPDDAATSALPQLCHSYAPALPQLCPCSAPALVPLPAHQQRSLGAFWAQNII